MTTASVVFYNNPEEEVIKVLDSLQNSSVDIVYAVDHSDSPYIKNIADRYSKVTYNLYENLGFGAGHNRALKLAIERDGSDYHAIINPDIYWDGDAIKELSDFMDKNPDCGLVMPKILFPNGDIQYLCKLLPTPLDLFGRRFIPFKQYVDKLNANYEMRWSGYNKIMEIPCLSGCFMFVRSDIIKKTGGFDERFFLYAEDMDFCRRIGDVSKTIYNPNIKVYHTFHRASYRSVKYLQLHMVSIFKYFNKWGWFFDKRRKLKNKTCIDKIKNGSDQNRIKR